MNQKMLKRRATGLIAGFSSGQRTVVLLAVIGLAIGGTLFAQWAARPTMVPLFGNLSADDASAITSKLQSSKTQYQLANGGATILVPESKVYQLRLDMAGQGLPNGASSGYSILDKQGITTSDFIEHVDYQRALEGELSKTIGAIQDVSAASVHLVIPQSDVFSGDTKKPSASVLVKTRSGKTLTSTQVQSIVNLTASSVESLDPNDVTVADDKGRMLAAPGQGVNGTDDSQREKTVALEDNLTNKVQSILTPLVGAGHSVVQARAELNWDKVSQSSEVYNPDNKPSQTKSESNQSETYTNGAGSSATGCLGTQTPANGVCTPASSGSSGSGSGNYATSNVKKDYNTDRTVTQTEKAAGSPDRISVAVLVDSSVPGVDTQQVEALVTQAAGLQPARGDSVVVTRMPFDKTAATASAKALKDANASSQTSTLVNIIKITVTLLIILAVLALLFISTKKQADHYRVSPITMAELDAVIPELQAAGRDDENAPDAIERAKVDREITDLIEKQPDEVASLLRSWLADRRT